MFVSFVFSNLAWCLAFKYSIKFGRTKKRKKEGKKGKRGERKERAVCMEKITGNEVKLEQDCEEIHHDSMGSMASLKTVKQ